MNDLENLLNLDSEIFPMDNGYWVKFEAKRVEKIFGRVQNITWRITDEKRENN